MTAFEYKAKYSPYRKFIDEYSEASNAATGSKFDSNANVENKNVTTCTGELFKKDAIGTNRLRMIEKITELYGEDLAEEYIRQLDSHEIYRHDETHPLYPYTYGAQEVVNVIYGGKKYTVSFSRLYDICNGDEELLDEENGVWAKYPEDMLIEDKGGFTKVNRVIRKVRHRDLVRVKTAFGNDIIVTDNHPLIVSDNIEDTISACDSVGEKQYFYKSKMQFSGTEFIDTEDILTCGHFCVDELNNCFMIQCGNNSSWYSVPKKISADRDLGYFVGFFVGDGYYMSGSSTICVVQKNDAVLYRIANIVFDKFNSPTSIRYDITCDKYVLYIYNPAVYVLMKNIFRIGAYSQNKSIPENVFDYTEQFAIGLMEGIIDSDGTIGTGGEYQIRLSSRTAVSQISSLLNALNILSGNTSHQTRFGCNEKIEQKYQLFGVNFRDND